MNDKWPIVLESAADHAAWHAACRVRLGIEITSTAVRIQTGEALRQFANSLGLVPKLSPYWTANVRSLVSTLNARAAEIRAQPRIAP